MSSCADSENVDDSRAARGSGGFRAVARTVRRRAVDLAAVGILAAVLLSIGGTLTEWWRTGPEDLGPAVEPTVGPAFGPEGAVAVGFGDSGRTLRRASVVGDRKRASAALLEACRRAARSAPVPSEPPDAAERRMLEHVASRVPEEAEGAWRLYREDRPVPMVVAVRRFDEDRARQPLDAAPETLEGAWRVVAWGITFPYGEDTWTLFTFSGSQEGGSGVAVPEVSLPAGSRRILSLGDGQAAIVAFEGDGRPGDWRRHFDAQAAASGWRVARSWPEAAAESRAGGWTARYVPMHNQDGNPDWTIDVQFAAGRDGRLSGLVTTAAGRRAGTGRAE